MQALCAVCMMRDKVAGEVVSVLQPGPYADWAALTGELIWPPRGSVAHSVEQRDGGGGRLEGEWVEVTQVELRDGGTGWK